MSPEQVAGEPLDGRSDLYAVGILAYYALVGHFPFTKPTAPAILLAHVRDAVPPLVTTPPVPAALDALVHALLAKDAAARPVDAARVAAQLRAILQSLPTDAAVASASSHGAPERLATVEAHAVWARAAELQADTQAIARPATFPAAPAAPLPTGAGFARDAVRASAIEAGIPASYVDRALAERDGARGAGTVVRVGANTRPATMLSGAPMALEFEATIERELSADELEEAVEVLRRVFGDVGTVGTVGRTLTYVADGAARRNRGVRTTVTIVTRGGRTTIRAFETLGPLAGQYFGGIIGGLGGGMGGGVVGIVAGSAPGLGAAAPLLAVAGWLGGTYFLARAMFARAVDSRAADLKRAIAGIVETLGDGTP
ncbi:MAG: hypothetical protein MUE41_08200 [Gemmatimonadaceae bacterium]|nr:hypothetical protein [Gemmatimonadaceae bacterium]